LPERSEDSRSGSKSPYELNATYFSAVRKAGDDESAHLERFILSQTVPMCLRGIPAFYLHSFTATPNDVAGMERTGRNRSINRRRWDAEEVEALLRHPDTPAAKTLAALTGRLRLRATLPEFHPDVAQEVVEGDPRCLVVRRDGLFAAHNLSDEPVTLPRVPREIVLGDPGVEAGDGGLRMPPRSLCWFREG
jgi:sucrose phosphorylase